MENMRLINSQGEYERIEHPNEVRLREQNYFKGWMCSIGRNSLHIDIVGDVWRGTCKQGEKMGNIHDDNFQLKLTEDWIQCQKTVCGCNSDIQTDKYKSEEYRGLLDTKTQTTRVEDAVAVKNIIDHEVQINWTFNQRCNYECHYCPPYLHSKTSPHIEYYKLERTLDQIINLYQDKNLMFHFAGGEPTMYPQFVDFVKLIKEKTNSRIMITSNMARSFNYFNDLSKNLHAIMCSFHFDYVWRMKEKHTDKLNKLIGKNPGTIYVLRFMMIPGQVAEIIQYSKTFMSEGNVTKEFIPIRSLENGKHLGPLVDDYTDTELELIKDIQRNYE